MIAEQADAHSRAGPVRTWARRVTLFTNAGSIPAVLCIGHDSCAHCLGLILAGSGLSPLASNSHTMTRDMDRPIFVCGPSRSGTALVRSIINGSGQAFLAGETHYFDDLRPRLGDGAAVRPLDEREARITADYFLALSHRPYGHQGDPQAGRIGRRELQAAAAKRGATGDAHFEAYCRIEAGLAGATRWGEKTPRHVFRIGEIMNLYPDAQVVCLVRDPRAVVASYRDWKNQGGFDFDRDPGHQKALEADQQRARQSYNPLIASLLWRGAVAAAWKARARFGEHRVRLERYEDVVSAPEASVIALAAWLGVPFVDAILQVPVHNSSHLTFAAQGGIVDTAVARWRTCLSMREVGTIESVCGRLMDACSYARHAPRGARLHASRAWLGLPWAASKAIRANRHRISSLPRYVLARMFPSTRS